MSETTQQIENQTVNTELNPEAHEARYNEVIAQADDAFEKKNWEVAKKGYTEAIQLKPDQKYPKERAQATDVAAAKEVAILEKKEMEYMDKRIPYLEKQARFTKLLADIDENRVRRMESQLRYARMTQKQPTAEQIEEMKKKHEESKNTGLNEDPNLKGAQTLTVEK